MLMGRLQTRRSAAGKLDFFLFRQVRVLGAAHTGSDGIGQSAHLSVKL
jgi:hypothetical protein